MIVFKVFTAGPLLSLLRPNCFLRCAVTYGLSAAKFLAFRLSTSDPKLRPKNPVVALLLGAFCPVCISKYLKYPAPCGSIGRFGMYCAARHLRGGLPGGRNRALPTIPL
jgi:hypothetical protein